MAWAGARWYAATVMSVVSVSAYQNETALFLREHFERNVWRWGSQQGRTWDRQFGSDQAMRPEWSRLTGQAYPGSDRDGRDLHCHERGALQQGEVRKKYMEEVIKTLVKERDLPLARSLEIGPCNNPIDLPTSLVRVADSIDSAAGAYLCSTKAAAQFGACGARACV